MPPTHTRKTSPTRESVWFVVVWYAGALTKTCTYFWNEGRLVTQRILLPSGFYEDDWYFYDESGSPYGFNFTNSNNESGIRYFVRNLQGDIIESGSSTSFGASHKYDAWGAITETVLGSSTNAANFQYGYIFAYRGYQYDKETGLYYCQSRYYNPRTAKFLNFDEIMVLYRTIGGITNANGFAYCGNNAVNFTDYDGYFKKEMHLTQTYEWALAFLGDNKIRKFTDKNERIKDERKKLAEAFAKANESVDKKWATSPLNIYSEAAQSWHFNTNDHKTGSKYKTDTRDDHYKKQKAKAEKLMKSGKYIEAIQELGKGLHALQDKITHTHGKNGTSKRTSITVSYEQPGGRGTRRVDTLVYFYWHGLGSGPDSYKEANEKKGYLGCEKFRAAKKVTEEALELYVTMYKKKFG